MRIGLQEGEIRQAIAKGGHVRSVVVISSCTCNLTEHQAYLLPSWRRELLPLRTWGDKADRAYRNLDRLLLLLREDFGYKGLIPVYLYGDPEVARSKALAKAMSPPTCDCKRKLIVFASAKTEPVAT